MSREFTRIKYCNWCGDPFEVKSPNQKYCSPGIKDCGQEAKRESWRKAAYRYREKYKNVLQISQVYKLGSGWLGSSAKDDFNEEYRAIQNEKKRLKLNGILAGAYLWVQLVSQFSMKNILPRADTSFVEVWPQLIVLIMLVLAVLIFGHYYK